MKLLRNPEIKRSLAVLLCVCAVFITAAFVMDIFYGLVTLVLCVFFAVFYVSVSNARYKRIAELAESVDKILLGGDAVSFDKYSEGELSILGNEIGKMTLMLAEQSKMLKSDKNYLAELLADVSHQIRTPLTSVNLLVSLISAPDITDERRDELSHKLFILLSHIDRLITALLKMSRLDAGTVIFKKETVPLSELIEKACEPFNVPMELRAQELSVFAEGDFTGDISWTCEALGNIVKNCMEHTPDGGKIEIRASENAVYTEITVCDSGGGIPEDELPHIFERFYKGSKSGDNSFGIGLSLAGKIVQSQNGTVKASNNEYGAVFTVRFYKTII